MSHKIGRPRIHKYTKSRKMTYSNKELVREYIKKKNVPRDTSIKVTPVYFTKFNNQQELTKKIFAIRSKVKSLEIDTTRTNVLIVAYRHKVYKPLQLEQDVKDFLSSLWDLEVIDEADLV